MSKSCRAKVEFLYLMLLLGACTGTWCGCNWPWPLDRADDPRRCTGGCGPQQMCHMGNCVPAARDGGPQDQQPLESGRPDDARPDAPDRAVQDLTAGDGKTPVAPPVWKSCPSGSYTMGSPATEQCLAIKEAQHSVQLTHAFEIQSTEVTQGQFTSLMGYSPSYFSSCGGTCPVENVSWHEAAAYANALSVKAGKAVCYACTGSGASVTCSEATAYSGQNIYSCPGYRLPTEAEWEYAYRSGTSTAYYNGDNNPSVCSTCSSKDAKLDAIGWYCANSDVTYAGCVSDLGRCKGTHPAGQKTPNAWGLYDMSGNVWEWCHDWYDPLAYTKTAAKDPVMATMAPGSGKVARGGAWKYYAAHALGSFRSNYAPAGRESFIGFRPCRTVP